MFKFNLFNYKSNKSIDKYKIISLFLELTSLLYNITRVKRNIRYDMLNRIIELL